MFSNNYYNIQSAGILCSSKVDQKFEPTISASVAAVGLFVTSALVVTLVILTTILIKKKTDIKKKLTQEQPSSVYEEIDMQHSPSPSTNDNVAYAQKSSVS